jgi:stress-induced morphogen
VAPDYLNEAELHIFNKIKGEMEPTKLEVCVKPDLNFVYPEIGAGAWLTPIAIMHSRPNTSEISIAAHRACTSSEHCSILRGRCGELHWHVPQVQDISGGCGSMYALEIESPKFKGLTVIKQHKLVNAVLKEEIAKWHGVQLRTKAS